MVHLYVRHIPNTCLKAPWNTQTLRGFSALLTSIHIEHPVQWACAQWSSRQLPYSLCLPYLGLLSSAAWETVLDGSGEVAACCSLSESRGKTSRQAVAEPIRFYSWILVSFNLKYANSNSLRVVSDHIW